MVAQIARLHRRPSRAGSLLLLVAVAACSQTGPFLDELPPVAGAATEWQVGSWEVPGADGHLGDLTETDQAAELATTIVGAFNGIHQTRQGTVAAQLSTLSEDSATLIVRTAVGDASPVVATDRRYALRRGMHRTAGWTVAFVEIRHYCRREALSDGTCR